MYARSTTIMAQPDRIDDGITLVDNELMATITAIDGCMGASLLVERSTGRCIATTSWESEDAMRASSELVQPIRQRLLWALSGDRPEVQEWEIAIVHRDHEAPDGAGARVTWGRPRAGQLDAAVDSFRTEVLPRMEAQSGFCSASMLVGRDAGMMCGTIGFDSVASLEATREFAAERRAMMTQQIGMEFVDVMECELAVHHLRVPELV